jgi:osmotically-inducible protein OsmY
MKTDVQIQAEVLDELRHDRHVRASEIGVCVEDGVVVLAGAVCSYAKKVAAAEAAHRVPGVFDVANEVHVRQPRVTQRTDAEIAHAVRRALASDRSVPGHLIRTTVCNGWVTLEGSVPRPADLFEAERAVRVVADVAEVVNRLAVHGEEPATTPPDARGVASLPLAASGIAIT